MSRKAMDVSEIYQVYFNAGWNELTELVICSSSSLVAEVALTQSSM